MHELSIAMSIVEMASEEAEKHGYTEVSAIHLRLGPLAGVIKEALQSAYEIAREGSGVPKSRLVIEDTSIEIMCPTCGGLRPVVSVQQIWCRDCGTPADEVVHGRELEVVAMEVDS